jgi:cytochrome c
MMSGMNRIMPALAAALTLGLTLPAADAQAQDIRAGQAIARQNCAPCHAIGRSGRSARPEATPFRLIPRRYPVEALEEAFGEGISGNHLGMPDFQFSPREVDDLLGYLRSLGRR